MRTLSVACDVYENYYKYSSLTRFPRRNDDNSNNNNNNNLKINIYRFGFRTRLFMSVHVRARK
jgi:hypothetical protein